MSLYRQIPVSKLSTTNLLADSVAGLGVLMNIFVHLILFQLAYNASPSDLETSDRVLCYFYGVRCITCRRPYRIFGILNLN